MLDLTNRHASFLDSIRDWDLSLGAIWDWFRNLVLYYAEQIGWPAYVAAAGVIIFVLLSNDLTNRIMSLVIARTINWVGVFFLGGLLLGVAWLARWTRNQTLARARDAIRYKRTAFDRRRLDSEDTLSEEEKL